MVNLWWSDQTRGPAGLHGQLNPEYRYQRQGNERFKYFRYEEPRARDKASLDIFWLKDDSLDRLNDLPPPDILQQEIIEHLEAALLAFRDVSVSLPKSAPVTP
jgi:type I restriction enzyme M protein